MKYKMQDVCNQKLPRIITAVAMAGSLSLSGNMNSSYAENLEEINVENTDGLQHNNSSNIPNDNTESSHDEVQILTPENNENNIEEDIQLENQEIVEDYIFEEDKEVITKTDSLEGKESVKASNRNGWVKENNNWFYYENNIKKTGWLKTDGTWYWLKSDGTMASNEWIKTNGTWYWLKTSGSMASDEWIKTNGTWYWLKTSGAMASDEWIKPYEEWYWLESNGSMAEKEWLYIKGEWYWFKPGGFMAKNEWLKENNSWYWLKSNGKMAKNEIINVSSVWYRFSSSGKMDSNTNFKVGKVTLCDYLNVRSGPSSNYSVVGKIYSNEYVELIDTNNNWYKVKIGNGTIGWVSSGYIDIVYSGSNSNESDGNINSDKIQSIISLAKKQLGKPYGWGAEGPNAFDCSGLTYYVYKQHGITLPRTSTTQPTAGSYVSRSNLRAGDLVFFNTNGSGISHVGLYIGNGDMIHSTKPGDVVKVTSINSSYYTNKYVTARRVIN